MMNFEVWRDYGMWIKTYIWLEVFLISENNILYPFL